MAQYTDREFVEFSAVTEGVPRVREIIAEAESRRQLGRGTILFCDEIHRFNKAQQDAFLPHVERGTITLIGATTENPSFEINGALLSRCRVYVLERLDAAALEQVVERALTDAERGLGRERLTVDDEARALLIEQADGDARRGTVGPGDCRSAGGSGGPDRPEVSSRTPWPGGSQPTTRAARSTSTCSPPITSRCAGSDPHGALYWMARMLEGGEDPMTLFRRAIAMAAEDIGLADPEALKLAVAARDAFHMLGPPEGYLPLAEMTIYLATAPKSNSVKVALGAGPGGGPGDARRAGPAASPERPHRADEAAGLRRRATATPTTTPTATWRRSTCRMS